MLPLQDVVPTGRVPIVTLSLVAVNIIIAFVELPGTLTRALAVPFMHRTIGWMLIGMLFLWLFGDNVEARLGRLTLLLLYLVSGALTGLGAAGGITAVLGSYFLLLPRSRVLVLVPAPEVIVEVPAALFLAVWVALHLTDIIRHPTLAWSFGLAFLIGVAIARVLRRPVHW